MRLRILCSCFSLLLLFSSTGIFAQEKAGVEDTGWFCPKMEANFVSDSANPIPKDRISAVFRIKRTRDNQVWTGEAWVDRAMLLPIRDAMKHYSASIAAEPANAEAYRRRAATYRHEKNLTLALADYDRCIELDPKSIFALAGRAMVYRTQCSFERARADIDLALRGATDTAAIHIASGNVFSDTKDRSNAIKAYLAAIKINQESFEAHKNLGAEYFVTKDFRRSLEHYNRAFVIEPSPAILHDRALVHVALLDFDSAERDLAAALQSNPSDARLVSSRGLVCISKGDSGKAIPFFEQALSIDLTNPMHWHNRGWLRIWTGKKLDGVADLKKALELEPSYVPSLVALSRYFAQLSEPPHPDLAISFALRAVQATQHRDATAYAAAASAYAARGAFEDAVRCQLDAIRLASEDAKLTERLKLELPFFQSKTLPTAPIEVSYETR